MRVRSHPLLGVEHTAYLQLQQCYSAVTCQLLGLGWSNGGRAVCAALWHAQGTARLPCALCSPELLLYNHLLLRASGILPSLWQHCQLT
jgi:hypothetical protein